MQTQEIYPIHPDFPAQTAESVGGKAANLMQLHGRQIPAPEGFVLDCSHTFDSNRPYTSSSIKGAQIISYIRWIADKSGYVWDSHYGKPLVVSARSGAPISMPGMMDTTLNIGLTSENLTRFSDNEVFAKDCYVRLIQGFGTNTAGVPAVEFTEVWDAAKVFYLDMDAEAYDMVIKHYLDVYRTHVGEDFPDSGTEQLFASINTVFDSWSGDKAVSYREIEGISHDLGTSCTIQRMVFGNKDKFSGTGVIFSHDPNTGEHVPYGDFLSMAQGEDVVAGTHQTLSISEMASDANFESQYHNLIYYVNKLSSLFNDMIDVEFTIESGDLYLLQWRSAKCSKKATVRFALDQVQSNNMSPSDATDKIMALLPQTSAASHDGKMHLLGTGLGVTEGVVVGTIAIGHDYADQCKQNGTEYVYVAQDTSPDDNKQMNSAVGILTANGGKVSHAALIARAWGKACVVGFESMQVFDDFIAIGEIRFKNGDLIKINAETGQVWA